MLEENARQISHHRGELAAIVQYVYSLAASRLQPFLRAALARCRLPGVHWEMMSYVSGNSYRNVCTIILRSIRVPWGYCARARRGGVKAVVGSSLELVGGSNSRGDPFEPERLYDPGRNKAVWESSLRFLSSSEESNRT